MGDLKGHLIPGTLFFLYGLWFAAGALRRHFHAKVTRRKYQGAATYGCPVPCCLGRGRVPVEAAAKILLAGLGAVGEITFNMPYPSNGIIQHATMYTFFLLSGCVDVAMHAGLPLPPGIDFIALALAFCIEGLLFANHLHGRPPVDVQLHMLLVYVIFATVLIILLEARYKHSASVALARAWLVMLQGTWFWCTGIVLYGHGKLDHKTGKNDVWDMNSHMDKMLVTIYFSWHCAAHLVLLFLLAALFYLCHRGRLAESAAGSGAEAGMPLSPVRNGHAIGAEDSYKRLVFQDEPDDESDIEFERPVEKASLLNNAEP